MDKNISVKEFPALYTGEVTVELKRGSKTYEVIKQHNVGTSEFFEYILRVASGAVDPGNRPAYIYLISGNDSTLVPYGILYEAASNVSTTTSEDHSHDTASIDFTFFIPETVLPSTTQSVKGFRIASLSSVNFNNKIYAIINFDSPISVQAGSNIYLKWTLTLGNGVVQ